MEDTDLEGITDSQNSAEISIVKKKIKRNTKIVSNAICSLILQTQTMTNCT